MDDEDAARVNWRVPNWDLRRTIRSQRLRLGSTSDEAGRAFMAVSYIPQGYHTITPYLVVERVDHLLDFVKKVFDAHETSPPVRRPDGSIMHAEVQVGDSPVMMGEPRGEQFPVMPAMLHVYVK